MAKNYKRYQHPLSDPWGEILHLILLCFLLFGRNIILMELFLRSGVNLGDKQECESIFISFAVTPLCVFARSVLFFRELSCFIYYYRGVEFRNSGDFSVLKRTVLLFNYYTVHVHAPGWKVENRPGLLL